MITVAAFGVVIVGLVMFIAGLMYLALGARDCHGDGHGRLRSGLAFMVIGMLLAVAAACVAVIAR